MQEESARVFHKLLYVLRERGPSDLIRYSFLFKEEISLLILLTFQETLF
jgi:hypothetical protein